MREFVSSSLIGIPGLEEPIVSVGAPSSMANNVNVCIFRYAIKENKSYKNQLDTSRYDKSEPPYVVDLYYIIIPSAKIEHEGEILTRLLGAFHDEPILTGNRLKEDLIKSGNTELNVINHDLSISDCAHLWGLVNKTFKPFLSYVVSPVRIPSLVRHDEVMVKDTTMDYSGNKR